MGKIYKVCKVVIMKTLLLLIMAGMFSSCRNYPPEASSYVIIEGDTIPLFAAVLIDFNPNYDERRYLDLERRAYYRNDSIIVDIAIEKAKDYCFQDTIVYLLKDDSIINVKTNEFYLLKNEHIIAEDIIGAKGIIMNEYETNKLINTYVEGKIYSKSHWTNGNIDSIIVDDKEINKRIKMTFNYNPFKSQRKTKNGGLCFYIDHLGWDRIPFIILGLYGDIPQADLKTVKNESFRSGKDDTYIYENHFDDEGNLIKFYFPERGVSLELKYEESRRH